MQDILFSFMRAHGCTYGEAAASVQLLLWAVDWVEY